MVLLKILSSSDRELGPHRPHAAGRRQRVPLCRVSEELLVLSPGQGGGGSRTMGESDPVAALLGRPQGDSAAVGRAPADGRGLVARKARSSSDLCRGPPSARFNPSGGESTFIESMEYFSMTTHLSIYVHVRAFILITSS